MNNYEKALLMKEIEDYETRTGQKLGFQLTASEAFFKLFGVTSEKEQVLFDMAKLQKDRKKYIDDTAQRIIKDLHTIEDFYGTVDVNSTEDFKKMSKELYSRIGFLVNLYAKDGMQEELLTEVWKLDARRQEKGLPSIVKRIMDRKQYEIDQYRQRELIILNKIRETDPGAAKALEWMYYDIQNFDKKETVK